MTDRKLHNVPEETIHLYPWYKERLRTKFLKDTLKKQQLLGAIDGRRRRNLNAGLDGCRDGYLVSCAETLIQRQCGTAPVIFGLPNRACPGRLPTRFTKEQNCFSKQNRLSQERRQFVEAVEHKLKTHPLALYSYLESGMTPELFDEVLFVLDPDIHVKREPAITSSEKQVKHTEENVAPFEGLPQKLSDDGTTKPLTSTATRKEDVKGFSSRNPYQWKDVKDAHAKGKNMTNVEGRTNSCSQDEDLKKVIKLFCDWVISLGGETNNLTESTILSLFVSRYEKKPALTFPIQVLEPSHIPKELRPTGECLHTDSSCTAQLKDSKLNKACTPRVKTIYGAWYLHPKTWKKQPADELLIDQSVIKDLELSEQPTEKDEELKQIHGTQAFKQFIINKGLRMPRFLSSLFLEEEQESSTRGTDRTGSAPTRKGTFIL